MTDETAAPAVTPAPVAKIVAGDRARTKTVTLEWPVEFDGKVYETVTVRRLSAKEVAEFVDAAQAGLNPHLPMFDCPREVMDAMDADDVQNVNAAVTDFLPRALATAAS